MNYLQIQHKMSNTGEKKRKRQDNGDGRPPKKTAVAKSLGTTRVEHVKNTGAVGPVLGMRHVQLLVYQAFIC